MTARPAHIPADYDRVRIVEGHDAVVQPLRYTENCNLWSRGDLGLDFNALADKLKPGLLTRNDTKTYELFDFKLRAMFLRGAARRAAEFVIEDMSILARHFDTVFLRTGRTYYQTPIVRHFHSHNTNSLIANYAGGGTEFLRNDQNPTYREETSSRGGTISRYTPAEGADILQMREGDMFLQGRDIGRRAGAFIHRAPAPPKTGGHRLLLLCWNND